MSKYIDADKLKRHYAWWDDEEKKIFDEIIDLQPAADVEPPQWIPVEDGLPEEEGQYLVSCDSDFAIEVARFYIDSEDEEDRWFGCDWNDPEDIVAWMPLPEPYKGGEEE